MLIFCQSFMLQKQPKAQKIEVVLELPYSPARGSLPCSCSEILVCGGTDGFTVFFPYQEFSRVPAEPQLCQCTHEDRKLNAQFYRNLQYFMP